MYLLALLLVVVGLALQGSEHRGAGQVHPPAPARAIELRCGSTGTHVIHPTAEAAADGVRVRFTHGEGQWVMTWENAPRNFSSGGSALTAEMTWPMPPGPVRILCHPANLPRDRDPYHEPQWWADAVVTDPAGHHRAPRLDCDRAAMTSWHGRGVATEHERAIAWEALANLGVRQRPGDRLVPLGYPAARPRHWGLERDGRLVGQVRMHERTDGTVAPSGISACADERSGQLSIS